MAVLALDLSTAGTGWALHEPGMERPFFGTFALPANPDQVGKPMEHLRQKLAEKHETYGLDHIVFEEQHLGSAFDKKKQKQRPISPRTLKRIYALAGMVEWFAFRLDVICFSVPIGTWRKHFIGRGDYGGDEAKQRAVDQCRLYGWHVPDHNAAEACGILDFYLALLDKEMAGGYTRPWRDQTFLAGFRS